MLPRRMSIVVKAVFASALLTLSAAAAVPQSEPSFEIKQVRLTEQHIRGFVEMQKVLAEMAKTIDTEEKAREQNIAARLEDLAKQNSFGSFENFDVVASNITLVISGIDPDTGKYTNPKELMRADIADINKDTTLTDDERAELVKDLEEAIRTTPEVEFPENVELVRKFAREIEGVIN